MFEAAAVAAAETNWKHSLPRLGWLNYQESEAGVWWRYSILCIKYKCDRGWLLKEEQRGIYVQNLYNAILPVSGLGSARVHHNTRFCIFRLNQKISRITLQKHLIFPTTHQIIPTTQHYLNHAPKQTIPHSVASSVFRISKMNICANKIYSINAKLIL